MDVLVDTCIWSLALRRRAAGPKDRPTTASLRDLIRDGRARMFGPIRQELLTGIRQPTQFDALKLRLAAFPDVPISTEDYETAADFSNRCRRRGVQGSGVDFFICDVAHRREMLVFTTDGDFVRFAKHLPIGLFEIRRPPK